MYSIEGSKLQEYSAIIELDERLLINQGLKSIISKSKSTSQTLVITSIAISIISNPAAAWAMVNTLQFINCIPLSSDPLTPTIQNFCRAIGGYNMLPNLLSYVFSSDSSSEPFDEAIRIGISESVFWLNTGNAIVTLIVVCVIAPGL